MSRLAVPAGADVRWRPKQGVASWRYGRYKATEEDGTVVVYDLHKGYARWLRPDACERKKPGTQNVWEPIQ